MCGLFGYIGERESAPLLIEGLKRLEYRGYDSAGIAVLNSAGISVRKAAGKITELEKNVSSNPAAGRIGIAHTRWATHGRSTDENSHPHTDCTGKIAVVHNGIVENYNELKKELIAEGHHFQSETDTEVIAHLIEHYFDITSDLETSVREAVRNLQGSFAIGVVSTDAPEKIISARFGSPLIVGLGEGENFISSDIPALINHTQKVISLEDGEMAILTNKGVVIKNFSGENIDKASFQVTWDPVSADKAGYPHYMLKEIYEQPRTIHDTFAGRISEDLGEIYFEELKMSLKEIKGFNRIVLTGCGTSWHAAMVAEYWFEEFLRIPTEVEYAAEFRYRTPVVDSKTLLIAISQSGETADTLAAVREAKKLGAKVISILNVEGSSLARESDGVIFTKAGPEIGVASTKAFTTQLVCLYLMTIYFGRLRALLTKAQAKQMIQDLRELPQKVETFLNRPSPVKKLADKIFKTSNALYLGRGKGFPIALEGALKLKEVSYIHAEGYPAAEMKHGPIALIDNNMPVVVLALSGRRYEKILGNIEEVKARGGYVVAIASAGDKVIKEKVDEIIYIPATSEELSPILGVIPLQLLAYYIAVKRGCDVDQPRNLAKSVTVE